MVGRVKRNFDGTEPPGRKISDLLPSLLGAIEKNAKDEKEAIAKVWSALLGEKMAPLTRVVSWKNGVLTIKVKSATLYALLSQHEKARLLGKIREKFRVEELLFRVG